MFDFDVVLEKDKKSGQVYASVPALPGCYTYGDSVEEVLESIKEAIELHLETMKASKTKVTTSVIGFVKVAVC
jgi:predicted RNase H-like HicB family nuclease